MADLKLIGLTTLYLTLVFVLVSLNNTYKITYVIFGKALGDKTQESYGVGTNFNQKGFLLHVLVFALLVALPMFLGGR